MVDNRRGKSGSGSDRRNGDDRREIIPLRVVDELISYDTLEAIRYLEGMAQSGDCLGIAFGAILRGGRIAQGYTGAAIEQPVVAIGMLHQVLMDIHLNNKVK